MSALVEAPNQVPLNADAASPVNAKLPEDDGKQLKELGKHARRRQKKKDKAKKQPAVKQEPVKEEHADGEIPLAPNVEVEYVGVNIQDQLAGVDEQSASEMERIFKRFMTPEQLAKGPENEDQKDAAAASSADVKPKSEEKGADNAAPAAAAASDSKAMQPAATAIGKARAKRMKRMTLADLKGLVSRPDCVEMHDPNSSDPKLLIFLKSLKNTVGVPRHWCQKRRYLASRRGTLKPVFQLPDFVAATGIAQIRDAQIEMELKKSSKQKMRERVQPKLGKMDIDYHILHDAFYRYQTKPYLTSHGDMFYEGKEGEVRMREKRPGQLSAELRAALGMKHDLAPPPWLINMQRYGPPPSYPGLRIPGLNYPIPKGASFGMADGQWGKPPVDEIGKPLYGDVFGESQDSVKDMPEEQVDHTHWGEIEEKEEPVEEQQPAPEEGGAAAAGGEEAAEMKPSEEEEKMGLETPAGLATPAGVFTPAGISSVVSVTGAATPEALELRKKGIETPVTPAPATPVGERPLYTVLEEKEAKVGGALFGSAHTYQIPAAGAADRPDFVRQQMAITSGEKKVEVALQPEELEHLDEGLLKQKYQQQLDSEKAKLPSSTAAVMEDVEEEQEHRGKKRKGDFASSQKSKKFKDKDFKF